MRFPDSLETLVDQGIIDDVIRPLMSGKEAQVYLVVASGEECVAKIYKDAQNRSFKNRSDYTEGRRVRNTRDQRAMSKRTSYGRAMDEDNWKSAEVEVIYRLRDAGVRVPNPIHFADGVLIMELVKDAHGRPAPRLAEVDVSREDARRIFDHLLREVVRMLSVGLIHGDLSDFNVLMGADGAVLIDFPQSVDAACNQNARALLIRDVDNLTTFLGRFEPNMRGAPFGQELWHAYECGELTPDLELTGRYAAPVGKANTAAVLEEIEAAERDEARRRASRGQAPLERPKPEVAIASPGSAGRGGTVKKEANASRDQVSARRRRRKKKKPSEVATRVSSRGHPDQERSQRGSVAGDGAARRRVRGLSDPC